MGQPQQPNGTARERVGVTPFARRPLGLKLIIVYKFAKSPIMLSLAVWLTASPRTAFGTFDGVARELAEGGATWARAGAWLHANLTSRVIVEGALLAWLDALSTGIEGVLLLTGKAWAEWVVVGALACLLPIEIVSLERGPSVWKVTVLAVNAAIVIYLVWRRVLGMRARASGR